MPTPSRSRICQRATLVWVAVLCGSSTGLAGESAQTSAFGVRLSVGEQRADIEPLSRTVAPYGYGSFAATARALGLAAYAVHSSTRIEFALDMLMDRTIRGAAGELEAHSVLGLVGLGYHLLELDRSAFFPYLGVGFDRLVLNAESGGLPLVGAIPGYRPAVRRDALAIDLGVGLETMIPLAEWHLSGKRPVEKASCLSVSFRLGYLFTAFASQMKYVDSPSVAVEAPRLNTSGYYFRLGIGWAMVERKLEPCEERCPAAAHAKPWCTASLCQYECQGDFGDCDNKSENGCETPLDTEQNCGECGMTCGNIPHGHSRCARTTVGSSCVVTHCQPGYASCNGRVEDGCEIRLDDDTRNCGECGRACGSAADCVGGECRARTPTGT